MAEEDSGGLPQRKPITHQDVLDTLTQLVADCRKQDGTPYEFVGLTITREQVRHLYKAGLIVEADKILHEEKARVKGKRR